MNTKATDPERARQAADLLKLAANDLRRMGFTDSEIGAGAIACATGIIATQQGPEAAARLLDHAADEMRGGGVAA